MPNDEFNARAATEICAARGWSQPDFVGSGAFKSVYKVVLPDGKIVALKVIPTQSARTTREIEALRSCSHEAIAALHDFGTHFLDGKHVEFTIEEYCAGGSLQDRLDKGMRLTIEEAIRLSLRIVSALEHLHPRLVHRDIKPANIMFDGQGRALLTDFGLVRDLASSSLTNTWAMMGPGTPLYAAPEQLNNEKHLIDWRSDQFGLGVVISMTVLGKHPYQASESGLPESDAVELAARRLPNAKIAEQLRDVGLSIVSKMTSPWSVGRFRMPRDLKDALALL